MEETALTGQTAMSVAVCPCGKGDSAKWRSMSVNQTLVKITASAGIYWAPIDVPVRLDLQVRLFKICSGQFVATKRIYL